MALSVQARSIWLLDIATAASHQIGLNQASPMPGSASSQTRTNVVKAAAFTAVAMKAEIGVGAPS